jgi:Bacterial protein of unknown function (DUF882)
MHTCRQLCGIPSEERMLPKPVTALALSALVSFASFSAFAAPAPSTDGSASASTPVKGSVASHGKKASKSASLKSKGHLAAGHSAEPKASPKGSPKLAASMTSKLDLKNASDKSEHGAALKHTMSAGAGKEVAIGGTTKHSTAAHAGAMSKAGRSPSRQSHVAAKTDDGESSSDDHPIPVALREQLTVKHAPVVKAPCFHDAIEFVRGAETDKFAMTKCDGSGAPLAAERLSVLVRPESAERPTAMTELEKVKGPEIAPGVRRIDAGLLSRLQVVADHFAKPGIPERVSIVSGYRPGSKGSYHATGQALDFHLEGVPNEALVEFCKTLDDTGCGYYPNSSFVHIDVRAPKTGHVAWIDTSGPGEPPHYVTSWPPPPAADVKVADVENDVRGSLLNVLPPLPDDIHGSVDVPAAPASMNAPLKLKDWE